MNPLTEIKNDISGAAALADWLGDAGKPVDPMVAEFRAQRCMAGDSGKPCHLNVEPGWWEKAKHLVAEWIKREIELKNGLALHVANEDQLGICKLCGCAMTLKVHAPIEHIKSHTDLEKLKTAPDWCWMKRELTK
jgi:hypothetical protein